MCNLSRQDGHEEGINLLVGITIPNRMLDAINPYFSVLHRIIYRYALFDPEV